MSVFVSDNDVNIPAADALMGIFGLHRVEKIDGYDEPGNLEDGEGK